ncbi:hypothetical protein B0H17DRAFT_455632 [Mycena rosella]|uniref:Uncharacterized protein n=1 Tax=Mycena rosella TaxID=1033263 RepID=A0AAD7GH67_MYCRO|nr:hypothetical protein B0H17DRAFT_455632 [Mycena rosella]
MPSSRSTTAGYIPIHSSPPRPPDLLYTLNLYFRQQRSPGANTSPNKGNGNGQYRALTPAPIPAPLDPQLAPYASTYAAEPPAGSHYQYQYQYRPPLAMDARGMEFLHDLPPENGSSGAPWAAPDTSVAGPSTTSYTQFFAPPPPPPESAGPWLQPDPAGPAPSKLTSYDSFWSSHRDAPAPDAQLAAAAYPRSAKGKGRAGVSSGRIVKRASPPDLPGHAQPPVQVQLAGPG